MFEPVLAKLKQAQVRNAVPPDPEPQRGPVPIFAHQRQPVESDLGFTLYMSSPGYNCSNLEAGLPVLV